MLKHDYSFFLLGNIYSRCYNIYKKKSSVLIKMSICKSKYIDGPYEKTIYEMNLPSKNETQQLLWYEYYMKINQLLYNSSKIKKKSDK